MKKRLFTLSVIAGITLTGCGGGGSSSSNSDVNGQFIDSPVKGLHYVSADHNGTTDTKGNYVCTKGQTVSFYAGGIKVGETACSALTTPLTLADNNQSMAANIAYFLQNLDIDGNLDNGIQVPETITAMNIDFRKKEEIDTAFNNLNITPKITPGEAYNNFENYITQKDKPKNTPASTNIENTASSFTNGEVSIPNQPSTSNDNNSETTSPNDEKNISIENPPMPNTNTSETSAETAETNINTTATATASKCTSSISQQGISDTTTFEVEGDGISVNKTEMGDMEMCEISFSAPVILDEVYTKEKLDYKNSTKNEWANGYIEYFYPSGKVHYNLTTSKGNTDCTAYYDVSYLNGIISDGYEIDDYYNFDNNDYLKDKGNCPNWVFEKADDENNDKGTVQATTDMKITSTDGKTYTIKKNENVEIK